MRRADLSILLGILPGILLALLPAWLVVAGPETEIAPGFRYERRFRQTGSGATSSIHLFRCDPERTRVEILLAADYDTAALPANRYRERSGATLVINGGFFDESYRTLGLIVRKGEESNPLRKADWGIFSISEAGPSIVHRRDYKREGVKTALQVGPRLVVNGSIPSLKETVPARRSALGIDPQGQILVALSEAPIGLKEWAFLLKGEAPWVINLDGGGSSQISAKAGEFSLEVGGETGVPNAVGFFPEVR